MNAGVSNHLNKIAQQLLLINGGLERINLNNSILAITRNLYQHFGPKIKDVTPFGSYTRRTMLLRKFDSDSDVDTLIFFNTDDRTLRPESYRERLKQFAILKYTHGSITKDHPSIVIKLEHTNFDLVPTRFHQGFIYDSIEIPGKDNDWIETDPKAFHKQIVDSNANNEWKVKPLIRLLKYWNATHGRPYKSYFLENTISNMSFSGDNFQQAFFYCVDKLPTYDLSLSNQDKVRSLQSITQLVEDSIQNQNLKEAKVLLAKIFPPLP